MTYHRCLGEHLASSCKFRSTEYFLCKKVGHIANACKTKQKGKKGNQDPKKSTHFMQEEDSMPENTKHTEQEISYGLFTTQGNSANPILAKVNINQIPVEMEVDTDASFSLINKATYDLIFRQSHTQALQKTDTGEAICILGKVKVQGNYGEQTYQSLVYVVDGRGPNLMGRDWLGSLNITVGVINSLPTPDVLQEVLQKHTSVFSDKLGTLQGIKVKLQTNPDVAPKIFKACTIPLALREKVETELERLKSLGIIIPVQHSNWAAPVVPVLKANGTIRLCGDYRVTINKAAKVDAYPLPSVEELFAALTGENIF